MREAARFASGAPWQGVRTLFVVCALLLLHARATEAIGRSGAFTNQLLEEADNLVDQLQLPEVTSADELTALNSVEPSALSEQPARSEPAADFRFRAVSSASATEAESAALPADVLQLEEVNHRIMSELQATANENEDDLPPLPQSEHEAEPVEDNVLEELIAHHGAAAAPADQHNTHATPEMRFRSQRAQDCGCSACPCQQPKPVCGCTVCPCRRRVVKKNPVLRSKIKQLEQQIAKMTQDRTESGRVLEQEKRELKSIMDQIKNTPTTTSTTRAPSTPPPSSTAPITPEQQQQQVTQELLQQVTKQLRDVKAEVQKREELVQRASKRTEQKITEESTAIDESTEQTEKLQVEESQLEQLLINLQERLTKNNQVVQQQTAQLKQQQALVEQRTQQMQETVQQISTIEREEVSALKIINIITRTEEAVRNQTTSLRVTPPPSLKPGTLPPVSLPPVNITMPPISTPSPPRVNTLPPTAQAQQVLVAQQQVTQQQITQQQLTQQQVTQQQVTQQQVTQQQIPQQQTPGAVPLPPAPPGGVLPPTQQQQAQPQPQVPKQQQRRPGERNVHQHAFFGGLTAAEAAGGLKTTVEDQAVDALKTQVQSTAK